MKTSEKTDLISISLIQVLPEIRNLFPGKAGYGYNYIPLQEVIDEIKPKLVKYDLGVIQMPVSENGQSVGVTTRLIHKSGQWLESTFFALPTVLKGTNQTQQIGASITYLRRYGLVSLFGIAGDEDVDGKVNDLKNEIILMYEKIREKITDDRIHRYFQHDISQVEYTEKMYNRDKQNLKKLGGSQ